MAYVLRNSAAALVASLLASTTTYGYEPDAGARKTLAKETVPELLAKTPTSGRLGVRFALAGNLPFKDYERLAKSYGYEPYDDCTVATFAEVAAWQIATTTELDAPQIAAVHATCSQTNRTVLGNKPLTQAIGDPAILRAVWQRNLEITGRQLRNADLLDAAKRDARAAFERFRGSVGDWAVANAGFVATREPEAPRETGEPRKADRPAPAEQPAMIGNADLERMVLRTVTRYGLSGVYVTNKVYLLLKDGSIFSKPYRSPDELDVAASKRSDPDDWGKWTQRGKTLTVIWPDGKPQEWQTWHSCRAANPGMALDGRFQSADSFGGTNVINFNTIAFEPDGRFAWDSIKGGDSGAWLPAYSKSNSAGRYELRGHTIRLAFNDGSVTEYAFCLYPKDDEHFAIGANHFVPLRR